MLKSEKAFGKIRFVGTESADANIYYEKKNNRDLEARRAYRATKRGTEGINELYMIDILREEIKNGDPPLL